MKTFTLGAVSGISAAIVAVPVLAQLSFAQSSGASAAVELQDLPVPSQACLGAMVTLESAHLENFDEHIAERKRTMQTRLERLRAAAAIADDDARAEALRQMHEEMRTERADIRAELPEQVSAAMDAVREACGDTMMFRGRGSGPGGRHGMGAMKMKRFIGGPGHMEREAEAAE